MLGPAYGTGVPVAASDGRPPAAGEDAAYVEMDDLTAGVLALATSGPGAPTGEIRPIAPRAG